MATKSTGRRVYARGNKLWIRYADASGNTQYRSTPFRKGQEAEAHRLLDEVERQIALEVAARGAATVGDMVSATAKRLDASGSPARAETVAEFVDRWLKSRKHISTVKDEESRLKLHVLPYIGSMPIADVRPRHIRDLMLKLRDKTKAPGKGHRRVKAEKLAPRTIRHVFATLHRMFKSAIIEELIDSNPVMVEKNVLPKNVDKDPEWRATAVFERRELETLISDERIPFVRRVIYAIEGLAGLRHGEMAGLRWKAYHPQIEPLGKLVVSRSYERDGTKTQITREVPVHPVLARVLAEWKLSGWSKTFERMPKDDDLIVPSEAFTPRLPGNHREDFLGDLEAVGLRSRRGHDLRRTFITLAQVDGAQRDILKAITHGAAPSDIMSLYTTWPWPKMCAEIAKLDVALRQDVAETARAIASGEAQPPHDANRPALRIVGALGDDDDPIEDAVSMDEIADAASARTVPAASGDSAGDSDAEAFVIAQIFEAKQRVTKPLLYH